MTDRIRPGSGVAAAGATDTGLRRTVNEDRFHCDAGRGVYFVVDGVGGQAAGGKAADVAASMLRARLERETGTVADRLREAITIANGEIYSLAATRSEWKGMACVLTAVVVSGGRATVGHVGDTRLYKLRSGRIEKITRDHSPVGEREDTRELSEAEAMRHPRRNEVYRDVGSAPHAADDPEFVDIEEIDFEPDAALLLCSDGLSDLVGSAAIARTVAQHAGRPESVVAALIAAANDAGGKDNVTAVYIEGRRFPARRQAERPTRRTATVALAALTAGLSAAATIALFQPIGLPALLAPQAVPAQQREDVQVVGPADSIAAAIARARAGSRIVVEPGEYREQLRLRSTIHLVSRVPRAAVLRLPASASELDPAVIASGISDASLVGFRVVGDAATPLGVGLFVTDANVAIHDVEISGATRVAVDLSSGARASIVGAEVHDNPGAGLWVRSGAAPRIAHSVFARNGSSPDTAMTFDGGAEPVLYRNVFQGMAPDALGRRGSGVREPAHDNWFLPPPRPAAAAGAARRR